MLYLLITGGVRGKTCKVTRFDFTEIVWNECSEELSDFLHACVEVDVQKRATLSDLLKTEFLQALNYETWLANYDENDSDHDLILNLDPFG